MVCTWSAPFEVCPSSSLLVCVKLKKKKKKICLESQNSWENVSSQHPLSLELACIFPFPSTEMVCRKLCLGEGAVQGGPVVP